MNRKLFKEKILSIITAVAIFIGIGLIYGFTSTDKAADVKEKKIFTVQQWYGITSTNDDNPASQNVTGQILTPPATSGSGCAQTSNFGDYCGVLIEFPSTAPTVSGISVASLLLTYGGKIVTSSGSNVYSQLP